MIFNNKSNVLKVNEYDFYNKKLLRVIYSFTILSFLNLIHYLHYNIYRISNKKVNVVFVFPILYLIYRKKRIEYNVNS